MINLILSPRLETSTFTYTRRGQNNVRSFMIISNNLCTKLDNYLPSTDCLLLGVLRSLVHLSGMRIRWFFACRIRYFFHRIRILPLTTDIGINLFSFWTKYKPESTNSSLNDVYKIEFYADFFSAEPDPYPRKKFGSLPLPFVYSEYWARY